MDISHVRIYDTGALEDHRSKPFRDDNVEHMQLLSAG